MKSDTANKLSFIISALSPTRVRLRYKPRRLPVPIFLRHSFLAAHSEYQSSKSISGGQVCQPGVKIFVDILAFEKYHIVFK